MNGRLVEQSSLTREERDSMFALLNTHFEGVLREQFERDLAEKNWAVLIQADEKLLGFSTLLVYSATVMNEPLTVVCSGDTIVSPAAWGSMAFPRTWIESVYRIRDLQSHGRLIWLLLTSGYRTYRFLPLFWREFFPQVGVQTPEKWRRILRELATERFGPQYCPDSGIVRFSHAQRLRPELAVVPEPRRSDPHVQFFLDTNPGHYQGDELVCIAELDATNLTPAGRRVVYGASECRAAH